MTTFSTRSANPLLSLAYLPVIEALGDEYYDVVAAAEFPAAPAPISQ